MLSKGRKIVAFPKYIIDDERTAVSVRYSAKRARHRPNERT